MKEDQFFLHPTFALASCILGPKLFRAVSVESEKQLEKFTSLNTFALIECLLKGADCMINSVSLITLKFLDKFLY